MSEEILDDDAFMRELGATESPVSERKPFPKGGLLMTAQEILDTKEELYMIFSYHEPGRVGEPAWIVGDQCGIVEKIRVFDYRADADALALYFDRCDPTWDSRSYMPSVRSATDVRRWLEAQASGINTDSDWWLANAIQQAEDEKKYFEQLQKEP